MDKYTQLKIEITGRLKGYQNFMDFIVESGSSQGSVFESSKIKIELLTELAEIIKKIEDEK